MRYLMPLLTCALAACATTASDNNGLIVQTQSGGQLLAGADCTVMSMAGNWPVVTPAAVQIPRGSGDLRIICNKTGYRTSEFIFRTSVESGSGLGIGFGAGSGRGFGIGMGVGIGMPIGGYVHDYPSRVTIDMNPQ